MCSEVYIENYIWYVKLFSKNISQPLLYFAQNKCFNLVIL